MVAAVDILRHIATDKMSETGEEVQLGHYILGQSRPYVALPVNYERNVCTAVIEAVLSAACPASRVVRAEPLLGIIVITVIDDRAIVAGENHQCIVQQAFGIEIRQYLTYTPVRLHDGVTSRAEVSAAYETGMRSAGNVRLMEPVIEEERLVGALSVNEILHVPDEEVGHVLIDPSGLLAAPHETDAGDSVDNGVVMAVMPSHLQHFRIGQCGRLPVEIMFVAHLYRIFRIKPDHLTVTHIDGRDTVIGGSNEAGIVEADGIGRRSNPSVPVHVAVAHSEMPFADGSGIVTGLLHHFRQCRDVHGDEKRGIARQNLGIGIAPWIESGEHCIAARRGCGRGGVCIAEHPSPTCERIDIGRLYGAVTVNAEISHSEIISHDKKHIRPLRGLLAAAGYRRQGYGREVFD